MWEWRVFDEPGRLVSPKPLADGSSPRVQDARADHYVILRGRPDVGLKVRGEGASSPKAELKLRFAHESGAESWAKVFERKLPLDAAWASILLEALGGDPGAAEPVADVQALARLAAATGLPVGPLVRLEKTITKRPAPPALELERTTFILSGRTVETLAIEAPTLELLWREKARRGLVAGPESRVVGYPEYLAGG